jgi:hypothetical protein
MINIKIFLCPSACPFVRNERALGLDAPSALVYKINLATKYLYPFEFQRFLLEVLHFLFSIYNRNYNLSKTLRRDSQMCFHFLSRNKFHVLTCGAELLLFSCISNLVWLKYIVFFFTLPNTHAQGVVKFFEIDTTSPQTT